MTTKKEITDLCEKLADAKGTLLGYARQVIDPPRLREKFIAQANTLDEAIDLAMGVTPTGEKLEEMVPLSLCVEFLVRFSDIDIYYDDDDDGGKHFITLTPHHLHN